MKFEEIINRDGRLILARGYFDNFKMSDLLADIQLEQEKIMMFGKELLVPRLVAYQGEMGYKYSGVKHGPKTYTVIAKEIIKQVSETVNFRFNSVLYNYYK